MRSDREARISPNIAHFASSETSRVLLQHSETRCVERLPCTDIALQSFATVVDLDELSHSIDSAIIAPVAGLVFGHFLIVQIPLLL